MPATSRPFRSEAFLWGVVFVVLALAVRWWGGSASVQQLAPLLHPVAVGIHFTTGASWTLLPQQGYAFPALGILVDTSCSGINFLAITLIAFGLLILKVRGQVRRLRVIAPLVAASAFLITLLANTSRVLSMVFLQQMGIHLGPRQHEAMGLFFFLSILLLASLVLQHLLSPRPHHANIP